MKNLKNTATAIALAATLMVGTVSANTEMLMSDAPQPQPAQCTVKHTDVIKGIVGIFLKEILGEPRIFYMKEFVTDASTCSDITPDGWRHQ